MAEEHRCQAPQLCINNCGFFGSPTTQNLCSKCYRDVQIKEHQSSSAKHAFNQTLISSTSSSSSSSTIANATVISTNTPSPSSSLNTADSSASEQIQSATVIGDEANDTVEVARPKRCGSCARRVGLTGFKCRCGMTFCGTHRYPEQHRCEFDFKALGKEQIAKANPVVKADKLQKI